MPVKKAMPAVMRRVRRPVCESQRGAKSTLTPDARNGKHLPKKLLHALIPVASSCQSWLAASVAGTPVVNVLRSESGTDLVIQAHQQITLNIFTHFRSDSRRPLHRSAII